MSGHFRAVRGCVALACVAGVFGAGCKQARDWAEKHQAEREAEQRRADAVHAAEPAPIRELPSGPGLPSGKYRIIDLRVEALPTNDRGKPWDPPPEPDSYPDLEITISVGKHVQSCRLHENRFVGECALNVEFALDADSRIDVDVSDRDAVVDDTVGTAVLEDPSRWGTGMRLPLMPSGRLRSASIVIARAPTWWELHAARVLGLSAGCVLALLAIGSFRSTFVPSPPPPARAPTCTHCGALLGTSVMTCGHCGAVQKGAV